MHGPSLSRPADLQKEPRARFGDRGRGASTQGVSKGCTCELTPLARRRKENPTVRLEGALFRSSNARGVPPQWG
jgi:hypothetical protein